MMSDRWLLALAALVLVAASVVAVGQEALIDSAPGAWKGEVLGRVTVSLTWGDGSLSGAVAVPGAGEGFAGGAGPARPDAPGKLEVRAKHAAHVVCVEIALDR